ncbi:MAG: class I SAM-dependent methyltransferase [Nanoarchaeota archaeon]|nr:class I SAM-dependent methyltransferase [Nanoarchaeota archaeon]
MNKKKLQNNSKLLNQQEFYRRYGEEWSSFERRQFEYIATSYKVSNLCALMEGFRPQRIIDFGCGLGDALDMLAKHFQVIDAIGIDTSSTMITYAKKQYPEYTFLKGGIEKLKTTHADLITFFDVLEHTEDIPAFLKVAQRNAKYIGIKIPLEKSLLITLLNNLHLRQKRSRLYNSDGHLHEFNESDLDFIFKKVGLNVINKKVDITPKKLQFSRYMMNRMKAKVGGIARIKYAGNVILSKLPYSISSPLIQIINGTNFFVLLKC